MNGGFHVVQSVRRPILSILIRKKNNVKQTKAKPARDAAVPGVSKNGKYMANMGNVGRQKSE
jgi:hypothetical protein